MKLRYIFALPIIATALMGCDEIEKSSAKPVENPQLPGISQTDFSVTPNSNLTGLMNLDLLSSETMDPHTFMLNLYNVDVLTDALPEGYELSGGLQFSKTVDFQDVFELPDVEINDGVASAPLSSLLTARGAMFGPNDPREYTIFYRVPVYVTVDGGQYKIGNKDYYFCTGDSFKQEGVDPGYVIEESYYLLGPNGTDLASAVKFNHNEYNVYDDTNFTVITAFGEGQTSWLIIPESVYLNAQQSGSLDTKLCYGPADASALKGTLNLGGNPGALTPEKRYNFSFDAKELTYEIQELATFDFLYTPGDSNNWSQANSQALTTGNFINYTGFAYLSGSFKFTSALDWDSGYNYGNAGDGKLTLDGSAGNLVVENAALYWCEVNVLDLTYSLTEITSVSMIGDFNDWNGDVEMTPTDDFLTWSGSLTLGDNDAWKFRMNDDWDVNLGGTESNLVLNGGNLSNPAGTYTVTLDLSKLPYSCTVVAQ